ncbi:uncharacterized protein LOC117314851 [Pecten maximus]|uniref:uncharacterized protein LOC117314851 n=1 Tax=Pecten maximus TaxID=6579 RepID=UPI00145807AD|nr:uncharacterized protein LOC117314851 [Pecten maximus]
MGVAGIHIGIILQGSILYFTRKDITTNDGYTAILHSTTSDSEVSEEGRCTVQMVLDFPPMTYDDNEGDNQADPSPVPEQDLGDSYSVLQSPKELFKYTYCDSQADTSSEQDLEWDFECPMVPKSNRPMTSSLQVTQMNKGSLKSLSSLESNSGYDKVVDWFKRAQDSDSLQDGGNEWNSGPVDMFCDR